MRHQYLISLPVFVVTSRSYITTVSCKSILRRFDAATIQQPLLDGILYQSIYPKYLSLYWWRRKRSLSVSEYYPRNRFRRTYRLPLHLLFFYLIIYILHVLKSWVSLNGRRSLLVRARLRSIEGGHFSHTSSVFTNNPINLENQITFLLLIQFLRN